MRKRKIRLARGAWGEAAGWVGTITEGSQPPATQSNGPVEGAFPMPHIGNEGAERPSDLRALSFDIAALLSDIRALLSACWEKAFAIRSLPTHPLPHNLPHPRFPL